MQALYDIESEIIKALPKMAKAATDGELKAGFEDHLEETKNQKARLEQIFELLEEKPKKTKVEAVRGLIEDTEWIIKQDTPAEVLDASLAASARYVEHYEIAGYTTALEWAELLDRTEIADLLAETLAEEIGAEETVSELAGSTLNAKALSDTIEE